MKRKLMIIGVTFIILLTNIINVYANTETTLTMEVDKDQVKPGETFSVILKATCPDGINGVVTTYSYDEEKLEYVSENVVDTNYAFVGDKAVKEIFVYCTSADSIQEADIYCLTFKVKEGVDANSTATISLAETILDSDVASNSEHIIQAQEISIQVVEEAEIIPPSSDDEGEDTNPPTDDEGGDTNPPTDDEGGDTNPPTDDEGEDTNPPSDDEGEDTNPPSDDEGEDTNPPTDDEGEDTNPPADDDDGKEIPPEYNEDNTASDKDYDNAGNATTIVSAIAILSIIGTVMYLKNKKYRDII